MLTPREMKLQDNDNGVLFSNNRARITAFTAEHHANALSIGTIIERGFIK